MRRRTFIAGAGAAAIGGGVTGAAAGPQKASFSLNPADYPPVGEVFDVGGLKVHATDEGRGGPPVILLHGASANLRDWTFSLSGRLARSRRVIAMDRPGFGYSERGIGAWPPARQAAQLRIALRKMSVKRPIVVGHSWGASVALAWALDAPEDVTGVISVSGASMPWGFGATAFNALGIGRLGVGMYLESVRKRAGSGSIEDFIARAFKPQRPPEGYIGYIGAPLGLRPETMAANEDDLAELHPFLRAQARRYASLTAPVEIIHGEIDWLLGPDRHALALKNVLPNARVTIAPGVGHMAHHARPDLLEAAIDRLAAI